MPEAEISKQTKKMLLLVSPENLLWGPLLSGTPSQNAIAKYIGVAHGTIPSWKNGSRISAETAVDVFAETRNKILSSKLLMASERDRLVKLVDDFADSFYDSTTGVYATAYILGMSVEDCQKTIDEVIYKRGPVFPRMYYYSRSEAEEYFEQSKGIFFAWVRRGSIWFKGIMHVRYVLEVSGGFAIRCKLNFPVLDSDSLDKHWEYDGFLVKKQSRTYWMFEKRQRDRNDFFYFITGPGKTHPRIKGDGEKRDRTFAGSYLTTGQDELQSVVTDRIFLQRIANHDRNNPQRTIELMHDSAEVIMDRSECQSIGEALASFEKPSKNDDLL